MEVKVAAEAGGEYQKQKKKELQEKHGLTTNDTFGILYMGAHINFGKNIFIQLYCYYYKSVFFGIVKSLLLSIFGETISILDSCTSCSLPSLLVLLALLCIGTTLVSLLLL